MNVADSLREQNRWDACLVCGSRGGIPVFRLGTVDVCIACGGAGRDRNADEPWFRLLILGEAS